MTVQQAYTKYQIPPNLQTHMLRVTGLASLIANNWKNNSLDKHILIQACLVHDMGNILKFDLVNKANFLGEEEKNVEHWKKVQQEFAQKYGPNEHIATETICEEVGLNEKSLWIVKNWGFGNFEKVKNSNDWEYKICVYSDHRIGPFGIVTLEQRLAEQRKRYSLQKNSSADISAHLASPETYEALVQSASEVEQQIQSHCNLNLDTVSDAQISSNFKNLLTANLS